MGLLLIKVKYKLPSIVDGLGSVFIGSRYGGIAYTW